MLFSSFIPYWAPDVSCLCKCTAGKLPPDSAPMLDTYISARLDNTNREITLCSFSDVQQVCCACLLHSCTLCFKFFFISLSRFSSGIKMVHMEFKFRDSTSGLALVMVNIQLKGPSISGGRYNVQSLNKSSCLCHLKWMQQMQHTGHCTV